MLAGQPELAESSERAGLRQLKQRIALRCLLAPLDVRETRGIHRRPHPHRRRHQRARSSLAKR